MKITDKELEHIEALSKEKSTLQSSVDRFFEISHALDKLQKKKRESDAIDRLNKYEDLCKYVAPEFPSMGYAAENGYAVFEKWSDALDLVKVLNEFTNYYVSYVLDWQGPGNYVIVPTWAYDHDKDIVHTATFKKEFL